MLDDEGNVADITSELKAWTYYKNGHAYATLWEFRRLVMKAGILPPTMRVHSLVARQSAALWIPIWLSLGIMRDGQDMELYPLKESRQAQKKTL